MNRRPQISPLTPPGRLSAAARLTGLGTLALCLALTACGGAGDSSDEAASASAADPAATARTVALDAAPADAAQAPSDAIALAAALAGAEADAAAAADALAAEAEAATQAEAASGGGSSASESDPHDTRSYRTSFSSSTLPAKQTAGSAASSASDLVVRARGTLAGGVPPQMTVRVNGAVVGTVSVAATQYTDHNFALPELPAGSLVDVVYTNNAGVNGEDRNLFVAYLSQGLQAVIPTASNSVVDRGINDKAFDGLDTIPGTGSLYSNGALRLQWPGAMATDPQWAAKVDAVRFLRQASFGATPADVQALLGKPYATWLNEQMAIPYQPDFVNAVQAKYALGDAYRPPPWRQVHADLGGAEVLGNRRQPPDQLRKRVAFALHQIFMVSQADSSLWSHARAYAAYYDLLNRHAFGNFRNLLEDMALSPAMGIYLSHLRNRKEDPATGRLPDENFAREVMQLFTIGLHELKADGSLKYDASGKPVETYTNQDVMALAKVFTGWSWAFPDSELTESKFRWGGPVYTVAGDQQIDLLPMKPYPGQHSTAAKTLFAGKPWATTIAANGTAQSDLKKALDTLFNHPNVGPFIGRQLIQRLVTSHPSSAYVARVAAVFANNGSGVRGDLGAVVRAVLLDAEARNAGGAGFGKLREPVLRVDPVDAGAGAPNRPAANTRWPGRWTPPGSPRCGRLRCSATSAPVTCRPIPSLPPWAARRRNSRSSTNRPWPPGSTPPRPWPAAVWVGPAAPST